MKKVFGITVLLAALSTPILAQSETGLLLGVEAEKKLTKQMSASVEADFRTRNNFKTVDRWSTSLVFDYKLAKWLKADAGYTFLYGNNREKITVDYWRPCYWGIRHRVNVSLTGSYKLSKSIRLSLREGWQYTYRPETDTERYYFEDYGADVWAGMDGWTSVDKVRKGKGKNQLRSRLRIDYDKKKSTLQPYAAVEFYNSLGIEKIRYTVGMDIKLNKQHSFEVFYRFQDVKHVDEEDYDPDMHYIGAGYKFKF